MNKIFVWNCVVILILSAGWTGISSSQDQTSGKAVARTAPASGQGETADTFGTESRKYNREVIAKVNGTNILMRDLVTEMNQIRPQFIKDKTQKTKENMQKLTDAALNILIFRELAIQEAGRQGIKASPGAVNEARKKLKQKLGSEDNYRKYLKQMELTEKSLNSLLKKDILFRQITEKEIFRKAKPNDKVSIEARKTEWESGLRKKARIDIKLPEVSKKIREETGNQKK